MWYPVPTTAERCTVTMRPTSLRSFTELKMQPRTDASTDLMSLA